MTCYHYLIACQDAALFFGLGRGQHTVSHGGGALQGIIMEVRVSLGYGGVYMRQKLLQGIHSTCPDDAKREA